VDGIVIEDDYDAEYRYDRQPVRALQGLDPARVAYTSSLSKTLAPGLRLGWLVPPETWRDELIELRWATDLGSLVHHPGVGDLGWVADAPWVLPDHRPARLTVVTSTMRSAGSGSSPERADRRQG
jgi:hypothetical protein